MPQPGANRVRQRRATSRYRVLRGAGGNPGCEAHTGSERAVRSSLETKLIARAVVVFCAAAAPRPRSRDGAEVSPGSRARQRRMGAHGNLGGRAFPLKHPGGDRRSTPGPTPRRRTRAGRSRSVRWVRWSPMAAASSAARRSSRASTASRPSWARSRARPRCGLAMWSPSTGTPAASSELDRITVVRGGHSATPALSPAVAPRDRRRVPHYLVVTQPTSVPASSAARSSPASSVAFFAT